MVERLLCKQDVAGSIPVMSTNFMRGTVVVTERSHKPFLRRFDSCPRNHTWIAHDGRAPAPK